jgi:thioredoxin-like negative regulator of GroEL
MSRTWILPALIASLALAACSGSDAAPAAAAAAPSTAAASPTTGLPRLVFFKNPHGRPCQAQDQVLQELGPSLQGRVEVVRFRTTTPGDLAMFERFGVRSLPQLVVTDAGGQELRRATPGILDAGQVQQLLSR